MSYSIEKTKRVLVIPNNLAKAAGYGDSDLYSTLLFVHATACNNVFPRTYDWGAVGCIGYSRWQGEIMLPEEIWECGRHADGGNIKCYGRSDVTGTTYVKQWKKAAACARSIITEDGRALWFPKLSICQKNWHRSAKPIDATLDGFVAAYAKADDLDVAELSSYCIERVALLYGSFKRLFPDGVGPTGTREQLRCGSLTDLLDAVRLYRNRKMLPFGMWLSDYEGSPFLNDADAFVPATWDYVRDPAIPSKQVGTIQEVLAA